MRRVLVANRGEIACRIIRTLDRMGIDSIAVFTDVDRASPHCDLATVAVPIGPAAGPGYRGVEQLLAVAAEYEADGVHPGYGFLSENADAAAAIEHAGLRFIGPTPAQIRRFGAKDEARAAAAAAGVPLPPGTAPFADVDAAVAAAGALGFPLLVKSVAGGGGIGMLACTDPGTLPATVAQAMQQSRQAFGNPAVFLERLVTNARHVEVQVFGDGRGTVVTLGDRDCSAQRRRQKVFEEAPAPGLSPATRAALADAARALLEPEAYRSAGTVEFVLDVDTGEFHFLEVNTRLQVEHTVTEATTGIDLVEWMVRAAAGDTAFLRDPPVAVTRPTGHAIEARVYAEDPARDFLPSPGLVTEASWPAGTRVDTWVRAGTEVTPFYDPLLAKVVVHAPTRAAAVDAMRDALGAHHRARHRDQPRPPGVVRRQQLVPRRDRHHRDTRGARLPPPPRRRTRTGEHHRAGPPGAHRPVARGRPAERAHGRPLVPAREPHPRQPGRRARARVHRDRADAALRRRRHHLPHRRGDGGDAATASRPSSSPRSASAPDQTLAFGARSGPGLRTYLLVRGGFDVPVRCSGRRPRSPSAASAATAAATCAPATSCTSGPTTMSRRDISSR